MAIIRSITTRPFSLALKGDLRWGKSSRLSKLEHVLVEVETDEGQVGYGEAPVRPTIYGETVASVEAIIREHFAPALIGKSLEDESFSTPLWTSLPNNHTAKGALDLACHDARAKSLGESFFQTYRGPQERVRVSYILGISDLPTMLAEARRVFAAGVSVFKVKIGRDFQHDEAIIRALKTELAGEDIVLYADANETLSPENAKHVLERLAALGVAYIEEPLPVHLLRERAALKAAAILPIIADDSCFTLPDLERELAFDTFDILNIKPARTGVTLSLAQLELAQAAGKGVMIGSQASSSLGTMQAAVLASRTGVSHPSELSFPLKLAEDSLTPPSYQRGYLELSQLADQTLKPTL